MNRFAFVRNASDRKHCRPPARQLRRPRRGLGGAPHLLRHRRARQPRPDARRYVIPASRAADLGRRGRRGGSLPSSRARPGPIPTSGSAMLTVEQIIAIRGIRANYRKRAVRVIHRPEIR